MAPPPDCRHRAGEIDRSPSFPSQISQECAEGTARLLGGGRAVVQGMTLNEPNDGRLIQPCEITSPLDAHLLKEQPNRR
jgi:hypothetical protein